MARGTQRFKETRIINNRKLNDQDILEELFNYVPTEDDKEIRRQYRNHFRKNKKEKCDFISYAAYMKGVLKKLVFTKNFMFAESPIAKHIEFLSVIGLTPTEILYALFTMGYKGVNFKQIKDHLNSGPVINRTKKLYKEYMAEIDLLKKQVFQDMASEVMTEEKKYLEALIKKLPSLHKELEDLDPVLEPTKWRRINSLIRDILDQCKGMHGIELYRETTVKAQGAIAVQNAKPDDNGQGALPMPTRHPELNDNNIIELEEHRTVIREQ